MFRMLMAGIFTLGTVALSQAHFPFVVPEEGSKAIVIFSDTLEPDTRVNIEKIAATKLKVRDASGTDKAVEWTKGEGKYSFGVPGTGSRVIFGTTDYGVLQKGEGKPFRLLYHPKALVGPATPATTLGATCPLEIVPVGPAGKTQFQVLAAGKPVADAEVTVLLPGNTRKAVKTGADGLTPAFEAQGRYGVVAKLLEAKAGEHAGLKYEELRNYATLVFVSSAK